MKQDASMALFSRPLQPDRAAEGGADIGLHTDGGGSGWGWTAYWLRGWRTAVGIPYDPHPRICPPPQPAPARGAGAQRQRSLSPRPERHLRARGQHDIGAAPGLVVDQFPAMAAVGGILGQQYVAGP